MLRDNYWDGIQMILDRRDGLALSSLSILVLLFFSPYLFVSPTPLIFPISILGTDLPREVLPLAHFIIETIQQTGSIPLWRSYMLSGAPLVGHPAVPLLYPPHWLILILPLPLALNIDVVLHLMWAGFGTYFYLRSINLRWTSAFMGAMIFALMPKWISQISGGHWATLAAITWFPWVWFAFDRFKATVQIRWTVLLGVAFAAQAINHGPYFMLSLLWIGVPALTRCLTHRAEIKRLLIGGAVAGAVMLGLGAGSLLPLFELLPYSNRATLTQSESLFGSLPPPLLLNLFFAPELKYPEWFIFVGAGALMLTVWGWARGWSSTERWWGVAILIGVVMCLGAYTPLYNIWYAIPGATFFRVPARWSLLVLFSLAILAAGGVEKWQDNVVPTPRRKFLALIACLFYVVAAMLKIFSPDQFPFDVFITTGAIIVISLMMWGSVAFWKQLILLIVVVADIAWAAANLIRPDFTALAESDPVASFLQAAAEKGERSFAPYGGLSINSHLRTVEGYDPFILSAYVELIKQASGCDFNGYVVAAPPTLASPEATRACPEFRPNRSVLALLNIRYVILPNNNSLADATMVMQDGDRWVYDLGSGYGRSIVVSRWEMESKVGCAARLNDMDLKNVALVETASQPNESSINYEILQHDESVDRESFSIRLDGRGLLVRSET
ncbi:MAG: YfhO family protein [Chloroflexi bacterium]|nr:YfhO family protein [Chloroflexota bacterium]